MLYFGPHLGQNGSRMIVGMGLDMAEVPRVRAAIERFGERFLEFWLNTTYLADGRTPVAEWENARWT